MTPQPAQGLLAPESPRASHKGNRLMLLIRSQTLTRILTPTILGTPGRTTLDPNNTDFSYVSNPCEIMLEATARSGML